MQQTLLEMRVYQLIKLLQKSDRTCLTLWNAGQAANQTVSELGTNASNAMNKTGEAVNATANELGKNASDMGSSLLNQTGEVAKKIIGGVGLSLVI